MLTTEAKLAGTDVGLPCIITDQVYKKMLSIERGGETVSVHGGNRPHGNGR